MVRAPAWPLDQTSALKPAGSLILSTGSLSTGVANRRDRMTLEIEILLALLDLGLVDRAEARPALGHRRYCTGCLLLRRERQCRRGQNRKASGHKQSAPDRR
jgi:hypothetical protein